MTLYFGFWEAVGAMTTADVRTERLGLGGVLTSRSCTSPGRRMRVFARVATSYLLDVPAGTCTVAEAYEVAQADPAIGARFASLPLSQKMHADPELTNGLQDLAWQIGHDLTKACAALDDPGAWYPGIARGIEPVTDAHVRAVIEATQRELDRETRFKKKSPTGEKRPAVQLAEMLPWRVQRAFVERRRLRYQQWGVYREQWERGCYSLWDVPEDPAWVPPWAD